MLHSLCTWVFRATVGHFSWTKTFFWGAKVRADLPPFSRVRVSHGFGEKARKWKSGFAVDLRLKADFFEKVGFFGVKNMRIPEFVLRSKNMETIGRGGSDA